MSKLLIGRAEEANTGDNASDFVLVVRFSEPVENTLARNQSASGDDGSLADDVFIRYVFSNRSHLDIFRRGMMVAGGYSNFEILPETDRGTLEAPDSNIAVEEVLIDERSESPLIERRDATYRLRKTFDHAWVAIENILVHFKRNDEGVSVSLYGVDGTDTDSIAETYATFAEAALDTAPEADDGAEMF